MQHQLDLALHGLKCTQQPHQKASICASAQQMMSLMLVLEHLQALVAGLTAMTLHLAWQEEIITSSLI